MVKADPAEPNGELEVMRLGPSDYFGEVRRSQRCITHVCVCARVCV